MAISGIPTTTGDDVVTVTPVGHHAVNGDTGLGTLAINCGGNDVTGVGRGQFETLNAGDGAGGGHHQLCGCRNRDTDIWHWRRLGACGVHRGDYRFDFYGVETFDLTGSARSDQIRGFGGADTVAGGGGCRDLPDQSLRHVRLFDRGRRCHPDLTALRHAAPLPDWRRGRPPPTPDPPQGCRPASR